LTFDADIDAETGGGGIWYPPFFFAAASPITTAIRAVPFVGIFIVQQYLLSFDTSQIGEIRSVIRASLTLRINGKSPTPDLSMALACDAFPWGDVPGDVGVEDYATSEQPGEDGLIPFGDLPNVGEQVEFTPRRGKIEVQGRTSYRLMLVNGPPSVGTVVSVGTVTGGVAAQLAVVVANCIPSHRTHRVGVR
jgi:hypothetical protein